MRMTTNPTNGLPVFVDDSGEQRTLGCLPSMPQDRAKLRSVSDFLSEKGLGVIPRSEWWETKNHAVMGTRFINNQRSSSGCVGWSGAQAFMRQRFARGLPFVKLSGAFIYAHINGNRDAGANILDASQALVKYGTCTEEEFNYPNIYTRQIPSSAKESASHYKLTETLRVESWDELITGLLLGMFPQFPVQVSRNFTSFDDEGCCGFARGYGNHSVHGCDVEKKRNGDRKIRMPNSWGTSFGDGTAFVDERHVEGCGYRDTFLHADVLFDGSAAINPPRPL